jgi:hypothetical protein
MSEWSNILLKEVFRVLMLGLVVLIIVSGQPWVFPKKGQGMIDFLNSRPQWPGVCFEKPAHNGPQILRQSGKRVSRHRTPKH